MSYLTKAKAALSPLCDPGSYPTDAPERMKNDERRRELMGLMVAWNERAAMMTCGDLTVEQAELAAWHDLALDSIFLKHKTVH